MYYTNKFLGGAFMSYGTEVLKFSGMNQENRTDPMVEVFPRLTKCTFHKVSHSGDYRDFLANRCAFSSMELQAQFSDSTHCASWP